MSSKSSGDKAVEMLASIASIALVVLAGVQIGQGAPWTGGAMIAFTILMAARWRD